MQLHVIDQVRETYLPLDVTLKNEDTFLGDARRRKCLLGSDISFGTNEQCPNVCLFEEGKGLLRRQVCRNQRDRYCDLEQSES